MKHLVFLITSLMLFASCCSNGNTTITVTPYPNEIEILNGRFDAANADFHCDPAIDDDSQKLIASLWNQISVASGAVGTTYGNDEGNKGFCFHYDPNLKTEEYHITVTRKAVKVYASSLNGFNYAIQTIKQMLPVEIFGENACPQADWTIPCVKIKDEPRFAYRGLHLDPARHFWTVEETKRYIDLMEIHRLNTFHWHLTDDQGWRIEIKKYPKLTEIGSWRKGTCIKKDYKSLDGIPHGGFYTQEQIRDVVSYAAAKGITVIPEIDLPGHMVAALTAYPELGCTGGPYEVWTRWGISDDVLCAGKEETFKFIEDVLTEVMDLFPSKYIHIGGDESPKKRWETCPLCQARIKELGLKGDERHSAEHYLQSYVTARVEKFVNEHGRSIIGWDEILEGELAPNATVMSWRGVTGGIEAAKLGHDVIMTPNTYYYLDYYQTADIENEPFGIGGYLPVETCYSYEPYDESMTDEEKAHILGVQANMWTEYIKEFDHLTYMLLPRLAALSEVQWCQPDNKDYERFLNNANHFCKIYEVLGHRYARHIFRVQEEIKTDKKDGSVIIALSNIDGTAIRYTMNGSDPDENSAIYTSPVRITEDCIFKAYSEGEPGILTRKISTHKAVGKDIVMHTVPREKYTFNAPVLLVDGIRGDTHFGSGLYGGWRGTDFQVTIDMDGQEYSSVTLSTCISKHDQIFSPLSVEVLTSEDGKTFNLMGRTEIPEMKPSDPDGLKEYTITFPETKSKYLKINAECVKKMPKWHHRHGSRGYVFVDEVLVK